MRSIEKATTSARLDLKMKGSVVQIDDGALEAIFNTRDPKLAEASLYQAWNALPTSERSDDAPSNDQRYFIAATVAEIAPRDAVERMLAVQMATTHVAFVRASRHLGAAETIPQVQAHYTGVNKLARTFAAQVEALRKYRNGGSQTVRVEHVTVEAGGQAIVGNVQHGGRGQDEK